VRAVLADDAWSHEANIGGGGKNVHVVFKNSLQMPAVERGGRSTAVTVFVNVYGDQESIPTT
jgi:hypothetical protein